MTTTTTTAPAVRIAGRAIGAGQPTYIVAELSGNHNGSFAAALKLVEEAKARGADAVKLQTYTPDTMTLDLDRPPFRVEGGLGHGRTLYDLYREAHMPWEWQGKLMEAARRLGIACFSSPVCASSAALTSNGSPTRTQTALRKLSLR